MYLQNFVKYFIVICLFIITHFSAIYNLLNLCLKVQIRYSNNLFVKFMADSVKYDLENPLLISKFENIGLAREDVKGLPEDVKTALAAGSLSPLMLIKLKDKENKTYLFPLKVQIVQDEKTNQPELLVYGVKNKLENTLNLDKQNFEDFKKGNILILNEKNEQYLMQLDPETKNILKLPVREFEKKLDEKLPDVQKVLDIELGKEQKDRIKEGKPVTLDVGGENVTIGVDLRSPNAFKALKGDMKEWERQKAIDYDIAHPEFVGIVQTDQNRWEKHMIQTQGYNSPELKQSPQQVKSAGMKL